MILISIWAVVAVGTLGGGLVELLHWWNLRQQAVLPAYVGRPFYWAVTALMVLAGGGVAVLCFGGHAGGLAALHVGAGTPLILQKLASSAPELTAGRSASLAGSGPSWRRFLRW